MTTITVTEARKLLDDVSESHEPIQITGKRNSAVLIAEDDWRAVQETLYLHSVPGMGKSIIDGLKTPVEECDEELDWCVGNSSTPSRLRRMRKNLRLQD
jgi:antitoxin YefM